MIMVCYILSLCKLLQLQVDYQVVILTFKTNLEVILFLRKVIQSRFEGGQIIEVDFAQLEFRTAVFLAQDKQGMEDIKNKIDVHKFTADVIGVSRQDAKAHTFKPLYGGTTGTDAEKKYYKTFAEKYKGITRWHDELQSQAITYKRVKQPTGRELSLIHI